MFLNYYGLREQPFGVSPNPRFLYLSATHREALASLYYAIEAGRGFVALIALPGMGKTTLLYKLLERLEGSARTVFLFQTQCDSREFMRYLLADLDIEADQNDVVAMHRRLNEALVAESRAGRKVVVVVDEAQGLSESVLETVRLLSNFETPSAKLMQIVLAGQPQLAEKLARPELAQLRQRVSILSRIDPLNLVETAAYIEHRLQVAGYGGDPLFTPNALGLVAEHSNGIPRNINTICFNALGTGYALGKKRIDAAVIREVVADLEVKPLAADQAKVPVQVATTAAAQSPDVLALRGFERGDVGGRGFRRQLQLDQERKQHRPRGEDQRHGMGRKALRTTVAAAAALVMISAWFWVGRTRWGRGLRLPEPVSASSGERATDTPKAIDSPKSGEAESAQPPQPSTALSGESATDTPKAIDSPKSGEAASVQPAQPSTRGARAAAPVASRAARSFRASPLRKSAPVGTLNVVANVGGAKIIVNGEIHDDWLTPRAITLPPGKYRVAVASDSHQTWLQEVNVTAGGEQTVSAQLLPLSGAVVH
jgi:type II secretory pathway predicted ATPase ExeA